MIDEVDEALRRLLAEEGLPGDGVELVFEAPTKEWAAKLAGPTISVFLYDLREETGRRRTGAQEEVDAEGSVVGRREPPLWYALSYLATVWTSRPQDEHRLLADLLRAAGPHDVLLDRWLTGSLAELALEVPLRAGGPISEAKAATDIWSALDGRLRPAVNLRVVAPMARRRLPVGPPVTEGVVVHVGGDEPRALRYDGVNAAKVDGAGAAGFAVSRPRVRRRRGTP
ncbi:DUF4255 domain-containing protein [Actinokineospora sp. NBRC 105648]|uniref:DUF4255 domain-containing protein n=1 Tax=Actinokineospora sp. NBRC 105648 TaxID=3032206 RepID=UPI002555EF75|nr:DUF4255 domain-containing protein [Actinokineospora sp. NBRC 105648]